MPYAKSLSGFCVSVCLALTLAVGLAAAQAPQPFKATAAATAPILLYPVGGETIPAGSLVPIIWDTNGASEDTTYRVEVTNTCRAAADFFDDVEHGVNGWTTNHGGGTGDWEITPDLAYSPSHSWLALSEETIADVYLVSPPFRVSQGAVLSFWHYYELEGGFDGGVVEIRPQGGQTWTDLGSLMLQNGYNGEISTDFGSPIAGKRAFTGLADDWIETQVDLAGYAGQTVQLRFREASDSSVVIRGWNVDDILVAHQDWSLVGTSAPGATTLTWTAPSQPGNDYCIRVRGEAAGFDPSAWSTGAPFTITGSDTSATPTRTGTPPTPTRTPLISPTPTATSSPTRTPTATRTTPPSALTPTPTTTGEPGEDLDGGVIFIGDRATGRINDNGDTDVFYFSGIAGQSVRIEVNALSLDLHPAVTLSYGAQVIHNEGAAGEHNARIEVFQLPATGTYKLLVASSLSASSGDYELLLKPLYQDNVVAAVASSSTLHVYSANEPEQAIFGFLDGTFLGFSPDGLSAAVATSSSVYLFSTQEPNHVIFSVVGGTFVRFSPDGASVVVTTPAGVYLYSLRADNHTIFSVLGGTFVQFSPDGASAVVTTPAGVYLYSLRADNHTIFSVLGGAFVGFSPDSASAVVTTPAGVYLYSLRADNHTIFSVLGGVFVGFSPDGASAVVTTPAGVYAYSLRADNHVIFSVLGGAFVGFSPDGSSAVVTTPAGVYVYSLRADNHVIFSVLGGTFGGFSPDGSSAVVTTPAGVYLYSLRADNHVIFSVLGGSFVRFSPDSASAVITTAAGLYVYSLRADNRAVFSVLSGAFIAYSFTFASGGGPGGGPTTVFMPLIARGALPPAVGTAPLTGQVVNAVNAQPLANVTLQILGTTLTTTTGTDGRYSFAAVPAGPQYVSASLNGFVTTQQAITIQRNTTNTLNFALSPVLAAGEMRIVLEWGERPVDLDSHLWLPQDRAYHIFFSRLGSQTAFPFAALDVDDTTSFGPETVTIKQRFPGRYLYAVYNYRNDASMNVSRARVSVYAGGAQVGQYNFPGGDGRWWTVLAIDGASGQVTLINTVNNTCPGYVCEGENKMDGKAESAKP